MEINSKDEEFKRYKQETIQKLNSDEYWKLIEHKKDYYFYKSKLSDTSPNLKNYPVEFRVIIDRNKIVAENGVFCPECDKLMEVIEDGNEWTGGLISIKSRYTISQCKKCNYRIKW